MAYKPNILIVDDSSADIHVMLEWLKTDFSIAVAKSGPQALAHCRESVNPKVILLDVSMPRWAVTRRVSTLKIIKIRQILM